MKNLKKIIALMTSVMMLSSVSVFAAIPEDGTAIESIDANTAVEYILVSNVGSSVKAGDTFDVAVKVGKNGSTDYIGIGPMSFDIEYDTSLFDVAVAASQPAKKPECSFENDDGDDLYWAARSSWTSDSTVHTAKVSQTQGKALAGYFTASNPHAVSTENAFLTFTFTVKADAPATKGVTLSLMGCGASSLDGTVVNKNGTTTGSYTFNVGEEDKPEVPAVEVDVTGDAATGYDVSGKDADAAIAGQKVLFNTTTAQLVANDVLKNTSRFIVKYIVDGVVQKEKNYNIYEAAKAEGEGDFTVTKSIAVGIAYDASKWNPANFEFSIVK